MKKLLLTSILATLTFWLFGQSCNFNQNVIVTNSLCHLADTLLVKNATLAARDAVILKPGFVVGSDELNGHSLTINTDHSLVLQHNNFVGGIAGPGGLPNYSEYVPLSMGGVVDVGPTGAANYHLPIIVSPGSKGMQPNLGIFYSSQSGNGLLGWGWGISGLSAISRVAKSIYFDNSVEPVLLNDNDAFAIDGVRLIKQGSYFYPANNPYSRIEFSTDKFTLTTQDGVIMQYGHTNDSKIKGVGATIPYSYALNRIIDIDGNYIDFEYANNPTTGEHRISEIKYTGNINGQAPYNSIKFLYNKTNNTDTYFIGGHKSSINSLLSSIKVYSEGILSKDYTFLYTSNFYSKLRRITLTADGVKYAPITINWEPKPTFINDTIVNFGGTIMDGQLLFGDFCGDGRIDTARYLYEHNRIYIGTYNETYVIDLPPRKETIGQNVWIRDIKSIKVFDYNGNEKDNIIIHFEEYRKGQYSLLTDKVYVYETDYDGGIGGVIEEIIFNQPTTFAESGRFKHYFADINNDGMGNHIVIKGGDLLSITGVNIQNLPSISSVKNVLITDFNGNGRAELLFLRANGTGSVWEYNGVTLVEALDIGLNYQFSNKPENVFLGDFNGDGKTDFLGKIGGGFVVMYSTGKNFSIGPGIGQISEFFIPNIEHPDEDNPVYTLAGMQAEDYPALSVSTADLNGDGKSDLIYSFNNYIVVDLSTGNGFAPVGYIWASDPQYPNGDSPRIYYVHDFNNDGIQEIIIGSYKYVHGGDDQYFFEPFKILRFEDLTQNGFYVNSVDDGFNNLSTFTYSIYTDNRELGTFYPEPSFPERLLRGPIKLATNLKTENYTTGKVIRDVDYSYNNGLVHLNGLGLLGFRNVTSNEKVTKERITISYQNKIPGNPDLYMPWPESISRYLNDSPVALVNNTVEALGGNTNQKLFLPVITSAVHSDFLSGVTTSTTSSYDGNLGRLVQQVSSVTGWSTTTNYSYIPVSQNTSRLVGITSTRVHNGEPFVHSLSLSYSSPGFPFRVSGISEQGIETVFGSWDSYGNVIQTTKEGRTNTNAYDPYGRFVVSTTNFGGYTSTSTFRNTDGALLSTVSPHGHTTTIEYSSSADALITTTNLPDGNVIHKRLEWINGKTSFQTVEAITNGNTITTGYNLYGHKEWQTFFGYNQAQRESIFEYYSNGLLKSETHLGLKTSYTYDFARRLNTAIDYTQNTTTFSYMGRQVTKSNPVIGSETTTYDHLGNIVEVNGSSSGLVSYSYYPSGKVKHISANNEVTSMEYDNRGNQISLIDPSAGRIRYEYNVFNELVLQSDESETIIIEYNADGSVARKSLSDNTTLVSYTYYDEISKKGLLKEAEREGVVERYNYDALGRPVQVIVTGAGHSFSSLFEYTPSGRLDKLTYPTGLKVEYKYDQVGNLTHIFNEKDKSVIWRGDAKNSNEMWTKFSMGNEIITNYSYNSSNLMLEGIKTGTESSTGFVHNLGYTYNDKLQLIKRTSNKLVETFEYRDDMNRLTSSTVEGYAPFDVSYHNNGNIAGTSQAASYSYNTPGKPYAVSQVSDPAWQGPRLQISSSFTADNRLRTIDNGTFLNTFTYGPSGQRFALDHFKDNQKQWTKLYVGNSEFILDPNGNIQKSHTFIYAPTGICAVYEKVGTSENIYYIHTDHLGSWLAMTDGTGSLIARQSFDAWGRPRDIKTWGLHEVDLANPEQALALQPTAFFDRGYTGHEHMAGFGLINMNGRVYDPYLQRFLSPDPFVQAPTNAQNYNRYSYVLNNPLMYTDPSGYMTVNQVLSYILSNWNSIPHGTSYSFKDGMLLGSNSMQTGKWGVSLSWINYGIGNNGGVFSSLNNKSLLFSRVGVFFSLPLISISVPWGSSGNAAYEGGASFSSGNFFSQGGTAHQGSSGVGGSAGGGGAQGGGDPMFWYSFPGGKIEFNSNLDESARHIIRAIRYSIHNGGLGFVNIDAIFNNFNPNTNAGSDQGFRRVFSMDIEGKPYMMQIYFATPVSPSKNRYNPVINFDFTTDKQNVTGPYQGHYWHIMFLGGGQGAYGPFIGVGSPNGSSSNYNFIYNWIYKP